MGVTHPQRAIWPYLRAKTAQRLRAFTHAQRVGVAQVPCRLPDCPERVSVSLRSQGTRGWFHTKACADKHRQRQRAIDAAITELAAAYEASEGALPIKQRTSLKADLGWFLDLRQMYAPLGEGRDPLGAAPIAEPAVRRVLGLEA